jgi:2-phosphosulfolactate phosphatase
MKIYRVDLSRAGGEQDTVVVIDVIRAFTTTAFAFHAGAERVILVSAVAEAFSLKGRFPDALLMGEVKGDPIEGFDFGNSPSAVYGQDLSGKTLIHRTSAGTQGAVKSRTAKTIYVTGLCNAKATARSVRNSKPESLTLVETGVRGGGWGVEDVACADYLISLLNDRSMDPNTVVQRVRETKSAKMFSAGRDSRFPKEDLDFVLDIDRFGFVMTIQKAGGLLELRKGSPQQRILE